MSHQEFHTERGESIRSIVLGFNDGLVTTLAIVIGITSVIVESRLIILIGMAEMLAGAISMALGNYISLKSQIDFYKAEIRREKQEIEEMPSAEKAEIYDIYQKKGFKGKLLSQIVKHIISDKKRWLDIMMKEELELSGKFENPVKSAGLIFVAFITASLIPIVPFFVLPIAEAVPVAIIASVIFLFVSGAIKSRFTKLSWLRSGTEVLIIGLVATAAVYFIGTLIPA
ncbi:MAG: VIT1/CCC1 transporter family protein [Candidatus Aenigmarchaeota archaeon]|nr:VIT1/CCC1 transporter family protein [Candidatus Aenigmarchaeota archaeon]